MYTVRLATHGPISFRFVVVVVAATAATATTTMDWFGMERNSVVWSYAKRNWEQRPSKRSKQSLHGWKLRAPPKI